MKNLISIFIFTVFLSAFSFAQASDSTCPKIAIIGPNSSINSGELMRFSVMLDETLKDSNLKFSWSSDKGEIISGQETKEVEISTEGLADETLTASIEIKNLPNVCKSRFSESGIVAGKIIRETSDEFGDITNDDVRTRIDAFIVEIQNNPEMIGVIINYGSAKKVEKREKLIKEHLKFRKFDESSIVFKNGGIEEDIRTRVWRVPQGVDLSVID